ncbi:hypothetical protein DN540_39325, partial [Burkholderia multivorans]
NEGPDFIGRARHSSVEGPLTREDTVRNELAAIMRRVETVARSSRHQFIAEPDIHDTASMAVIRLASCLERPELYASELVLSAEEAVEIEAARELAVHGCREVMDDDLLWIVVTQ